MTNRSSQEERNPLERALGEAVDADFYAFTYGELPAKHTASSYYVSMGWREGHDPNPWFSTLAYLERNPDVAAADLVPLFHYLEAGFKEGRAIVPSARARAYYDRAPSRVAEAVVEPDRRDEDEAYLWRIVGEAFDREYYLTVNPDVAEAGVDPLEHFVQNGWREGRDPHAYFSVRQYLEANVDVADARVNPFFHYLVVGKAEGRPLRLDVGFRYHVLAGLETVEQRMDAVPRIPRGDVDGDARLRRAVATLDRSRRRRLHLSVSHDDFTANVGGLQVCLAREAQAFERMGVDHVHLFPGRPLLVTAHEDDDPVVGVLTNGVMAGYFAAHTIARVFGETLGTAVDARRSFAIHSCLGHNVDALAAILRALHLESGYYWIHDYASACAGYSLLRNDVEFCGAPPPASSACELCIYGARRELQVADHERLFDEFDLTPVAPSQSALDVWESATPFGVRRAIVQPHGQLVARPAGVVLPSSRLRVAFLGYPNAHKGWPVFMELVRRFGQHERFEFHHLGLSPQRGVPVAFTEVAVRAGTPDAMIQAVEARGIDVALIWSFWPETFCFTAHEAIAGGAAVIAPPASGNVAAMIRETGAGVVVADEQELFDLFASADVAQLAAYHRGGARYRLEYSNMTADLIEVLA